MKREVGSIKQTLQRLNIKSGELYNKLDKITLEDEERDKDGVLFCTLEDTEQEIDNLIEYLNITIKTLEELGF